MYNQHFGFREPPFSATPNSRFFYTNILYEEAFANLRYGIEWKKGLIVMSGEVGTGKTTLLDKMMRSLAATTHGVFVSYDQLTSTELFRLVSRQLGIAGDGTDRVAGIEQLREYFIAQHQRGHTVALLVDEAQNLSDEMFEGIRFLSNFEIDGERLVQIVLTGQPELETRLNQLALRHLKQRVVLHCRLAPLQQDEVGRYIEFRLREAGYTGEQLFDNGAVALIASYSAGIPRVINIICDNALLLAYAESAQRVTNEMIDEVARDLGIEREAWSLGIAGSGDEPIDISSTGSGSAGFAAAPPKRRPMSRLRWAPMGIAIILFILGGVGGALYSQQVRDYIADTRVAEERRLRPQSTYEDFPVTHNGDAISVDRFRKGLAANIELPQNVGIHPLSLQPIASSAKQPSRQSQQMKTKVKESSVGTFDISEPFTFVRGSPRADASIIATLKPATRIKVLSSKGDYFQVQASFEGRTIRGYVHRHDAFFERPKKNRQQTAGIN